MGNGKLTDEEQAALDKLKKTTLQTSQVPMEVRAATGITAAWMSAAHPSVSSHPQHVTSMCQLCSIHPRYCALSFQEGHCRNPKVCLAFRPRRTWSDSPRSAQREKYAAFLSSVMISISAHAPQNVQSRQPRRPRKRATQPMNERKRRLRHSMQRMPGPPSRARSDLSVVMEPR